MKNIKLSLNYPFEDQDIYFRMLRENVKVRYGNGKTIVYLEPTRTLTGQQIWKLPNGISNLTDAILYLEMTESGGMTFKYSYSQIVCGAKGNKLKPYHISSIKKANGDHAYFAVSHKIYTIECYDFRYLRITEISANLLLETRICYISDITIFEGTQKELTPDLNKFSQAIFHAVIKANCLNCQHAHYVTDL